MREEFIEFKMDFMMTIIAALIFIAFITAFLFLIMQLKNKDSNREHAQLVNRFRKLAGDHDLSFIDEEIMDNLAIGLDYEQRKLLVLKKINGSNYESTVVDLSEIGSFKKRDIYGRVYPEKYAVLNDVVQLEKIVLELEFEDQREPMHITFYDFIANAYQDIGEMKKRVKRWEALLSNLERGSERKRA